MAKALVTGATRPPGRAVAIALAKAGYETCALGRDRIVLEEMRGDFGVIPMAMDLTDREAVRLIVDGMRPDIIVHTALRWPDDQNFLNLAEADIDMALEVNLSATLHLTRAALPSMIDNGQGAILVVTPSLGETDGFVEQIVTGAAEAFVRALQRELDQTDILVRQLAAGEEPFTSLAQSALAAVEDAKLLNLRVQTQSRL